tara:strand:+ start:1503 stop:2282 length:780 start_codon:yes stop_codon:yes gene_type:complete
MLKGKYVKYQTDSGIFDLRDSHTQLNISFTELTFIGRATGRNLTATNGVEIDVSSVASTGDLIIICGASDKKANDATAETELVDAADDTTLSGGELLASNFSDPSSGINQPLMSFFYWIYDGSTTPKVKFNVTQDTNAGTALVFRGTSNTVSTGQATCVNNADINPAADSATVPSDTTRLKVAFQSGRPGSSGISNVALNTNLTGQTGWIFYDGANQPDSTDSMDDAYLILGPADSDSGLQITEDGSRTSIAFASLNVT